MAAKGTITAAEAVLIRILATQSHISMIIITLHTIISIQIILLGNILTG